MLSAISHRLASLASLWGHSSRARFCILFGAYVLALGWLFERWEMAFARFYLLPVSHVATASLNLLGLEARLEVGALAQGFCDIVLPSITLHIIHECTGIFTLFMFLAAVFAFPASLTARLAGAALGSAAFFAYSSVRLAFLGVVGHVAPDWVWVIHVWLMILINLGFALCLWLTWVSRVRRHG
ncbi:hypothetical protein ACFL6X_00055 [Candidatus Latescibacterota bacterium]